MEVVNTVFIEEVKRTATISSFRFRPEKRVDYIPGQFLRVLFDVQDKNNTALNKYLSFSCAPAHDYIEVTKRLSSSEFSAALAGLRAGDKVVMHLPMGKCFFDPAAKKIAFLVGGIGVTPAVSIIEHIVLNKLDTDVVMVYANRSDDDIAFKPELDAWRAIANIKVCYIVSEKVCNSADCHQGKIDSAFCVDSIGDIKERKVFIFGPPKMVDAMKDLTRELGCAKENVLMENFIGY